MENLMACLENVTAGMENVMVLHRDGGTGKSELLLNKTQQSTHLHENRRSKVLVPIPPIAGAAGAAAGAQNAFVQAILHRGNG